MKVFGIVNLKKSFMVTVILTAALFLVVLGMRPPQLQKINKPRVHHRDIVQNQEKASHTSIAKNLQAFEPCRSIERIKAPPSFRISVVPLEERSSNLAADFFIPSRAPPTFRI